MDLLSTLEIITFLDIVKFLIVVLLAVYTIFALLMMKQISAMTMAVTMKDDFFIRVLGYLNFGFSLLVLILSVLWL